MSVHWSTPSPEVLEVYPSAPRYRVTTPDALLYEGDDLGVAWRLFLGLLGPVAAPSRRGRR